MEIDARRLRVFLAVADTLHFGRAGERLRVAQPSVSQQVARLERQLGRQLFVRASTGVTLTSAGRELARLVGPALAHLDDAVAQFLATEAPPTLRIGALSSLASNLIPRAAVVGSSHARIDLVEGSLSSLIQSLTAGDLDVVFCYRPEDMQTLRDAKVRMVEIDENPVLFAMPKNDPDSSLKEIPWAVAAAKPWVMPSASRQYVADMRGRFVRRGLDVQVVAEATTLSGQHALVAAGIGWTFTSPWVQHPDSVMVRPPEDPDRLSLVALLRPGGDCDVVAALLEEVRSEAKAVRPVPDLGGTLL